ncbi:hypothetical protein HDV05_000746 [Chytridiales sp. JEL 0842]|nr:hypothetical protein HDV05_000746 [Chytridiales sp. JEL 0842]
MIASDYAQQPPLEPLDPLSPDPAQPDPLTSSSNSNLQHTYLPPDLDANYYERPPETFNTETINQQETEGSIDESENNESKLPLEMLKRGLSELGPSPNALKLVYLKLSLPHAGLTDISSLKGYIYIQNLNLQGNNLTDISVLGHMRYLVYLNVSNNKLQEVCAFSPAPFNLQEIDFSRNQISVINDLSEHKFLKAVLAHNGISAIENLEGLPIRYLDLTSNRIRTLDGLSTLSSLEELRISHNGISHLTLLSQYPYPYLRRIDLDSNALHDPTELQHLTTLPLLTDLTLRKNPMSTLPNHRLSTAFTLPSLTILDGLPLSYEEKVAALNLHAPPPQVVASLQHAHMQKRQVRLYAKIKAADLMRATRLRPIVLCGPNGAGKRTLTSRLLKEFPHIYGLSVSHTTRKPRPGEENGVHYHFVQRSEMEEMVEEGKFVEVVQLFGYMYGTSMEAIDKVTEEGKVCVMDLEIEGVLALKRSHLKPLYIFITVPSLDVLQERLEKRLRATTPTVRSVAPTPLPGYHDPIGDNGERPQPPPSVAEFEHERTVDSTQTLQNPSSQQPSLDSVAGKEPIDPDVALWLAKAPGINEYANLDNFFDLKIVNDDPEKAYRELKDFCLKEFYEHYDEED